MAGSCTVETIWEADVKSFSRAYDLICIVDQIHEYAINHHRPFVIQHLEAWHARHQRLNALTEVPVGDSYAQEPEARGVNASNSEDCGNSAPRIAASGTGRNQALEWAKSYHLKQRSKAIKDAKIQISRYKIRKRPMEDEVDVLVPGPSGDETTDASISMT